MTSTFNALQNIFRVMLQADESIIHKVHDFLIAEKILVPVPTSQQTPDNITPIKS